MAVPLALVVLCLVLLLMRRALDAPLPPPDERRRLPADGGPEFNALIHSDNPYLLQHARNPVAWRQWDAAALAEARQREVPIFLSIGYSTCHWCHVMAHESFSDQEVGEALGRSFVCIKIDKEERPDVDRIYMAYVQALSGRGGWPLSVWLTPQLQPIYGGTYFPKAQFLQVVAHVDRLWREQRDRLLDYGEKVTADLQRLGSLGAGGEELPSPQVLDQVRELICRQYDAKYGGWGGAPKFPRPAVLLALATHAANDTDAARRAETLAQCRHCLQAMADGGIYDQLGGGFHRYSVDRFWHIPHYEKMLYDQGQLLSAYCCFQQLDPQAEWRPVIRGTADYVLSQLRHPEGGFFSAEDADSPQPEAPHASREGAFYVWTWGQLQTVLNAGELELAARAFGLRREGNVPPGSDPHGELSGTNTLLRAADTQIDPGRAQMISAKLFAARAERPRPHRDEKLLAGWNGLMLAGLAQAARVCGEPRYRDAAIAAVACLRTHLWRDGRLRRSWLQGEARHEGFADDYAYLIHGLLELANTGPADEFVGWAVALQDRFDAGFWDEEAGGWFGTTGEDASVLVRMKEDYDGAEPAPVSVAVPNLLRLACWVPERAADYRARALAALRAYAGRLQELPQALPQLCAALPLAQLGCPEVSIFGDAGSPLAQACRQLLAERYLPGLVIRHLPGEEVRAVLCRDGRCLAPVTEVGPLAEQLDA